MDLQQVKAEIEMIKAELEQLIDSEAGFAEIYETSLRLDKLIVIFQKYLLCRTNAQ